MGMDQCVDDTVSLFTPQLSDQKEDHFDRVTRSLDFCEDGVMGPDWLGSPQHVVGGVALSGVVVIAAGRWVEHPWLLLGLAVGVTAAAEIVVELVEYPLLYSGRLHATAYHDTIADMASSIVGALAGAAAAVALRNRGPS